MLTSTRMVWMAALLAAGCASTKKLGIGGSGASVDESALGRLPPEAMAQINLERSRVHDASDQLARAETNISDAKNEVAIAKSEKKVAKERESLAKKQLHSSSSANNSAGVTSAQQQLNAAKPVIEVADDHERAAQAKLDASRARQKLAEDQVSLAKANLEQAKFQALSQANDPSVEKLKPSDFEKRINNAQGDVRKAQIDVEQRDQFARSQEQRWRTARQQLPPAAHG